MKSPAYPTSRLAATLLAAMTLAGLKLNAADGIWNVNANGNWSAAGSWQGGTIADGAGAIADFSQFDITANRTATIDTTARTVGEIRFGDSTGPTFSNYTIAASGGGTLTFNNSGSGAAITQGANSGANTISAPVVLADNLGISNNSASTLTVSGGITSGTAGTKTITNAGSGAGGVTLSGIIGNGSGTVAIVQNSGTSALTLSGANTFTGGVAVKSGTVGVNSTTALGTGTVLLGDTSGSANATLLVNSFTPANNITVQAGSTGTLTIASNGNSAARPAGNITLNNNLTLEVGGGGTSGRSTGAFLATSGTITGTGNLNLNVSGNLSTGNDGGSSQLDSLNVTGAVNTTGSVNNVGTGTGRAIISGAITGAGSVNQNSATSQLTLSGANTYSGATNVNAGVLRITANSALSSNSSSVNVADGATLQLQNGATALNAGQTLNIAGHGTAYSQGAIQSTNNANYAGSIVLQDDATVSSDLGNTTLTLSGAITGTDHTLTTSGAGTVAVTGNIGTGAGGLIKQGTGVLNLSGNNTFTGVTQINNGAVLLSSAGALGGGGEITFNGGTLRHSATNVLDHSARIKDSTGSIAIDTNGQSVTYAGNLDSSNTGGLTKLGTGTFTISGTNTFSGPIAINAGTLVVSTTSAIPTLGTGQVFIDSSGTLNSGGAYADIQSWLDSDNIATNSTGTIALTGSSAENIDLTGYNGLSLGASTTSTYTGTLTAAGSTYRLGGGGATLSLSGTNALTGSNSLLINGGVVLTGANDLTGATTVTSGSLTLGGTNGNVAGSNVTVGEGATLTVTSSTSGSPVTRAASVKLERATLGITGNSTANSNDVITDALTIGAGGNSTVTITANASRHALLSAARFEREAGATALVRGSNLGVNSLAAQTNGAANIALSSTTNLVGGSGSNTTDRGIFVGMVGDTTAAGTGFGATGGLLTYDATNGVRLLSGADLKTSITDAQTQLDNVQLSSASGVVTTTVNSNTTINSLSLKTSGATSAGISVTGTGKLTLNSGVIYSNSVTATAGSTVSNAIDFGGREGIVLVGGTNNLTLSGALSNTGGNGLTVYAPSRTVTLSGADANTYTGTTTVNGGSLILNKTAGLNAVTGDLVVNSLAAVSMSASNQIADGANVTINGGSMTTRNETINNLSLLNGGTIVTPSNTLGVTVNVNGALTVSGNSSTLNTSVAGVLNVTGATNLSDGGALTLARSQNVNGTYDSVATLGGGLNITNRTSGAYTAITVGHGSGLGQSGAKLILGGDVTFTGNSTNTNTVLIDAIKGTGRQGVIELTTAVGDRTFNIGNGAAAVDLKITAALLDSAAGASGLVKTGAGTLALSGVNTYSGNTVINAGAVALTESSALSFYIGGDGVNNSVSGTGAVTFGGTFNFDLTGADTTEGNSWTIVNVGTLSESFAGTFMVQGFTETTSGVWTLGDFTFSEASGLLIYGAVPEPSTYALFAGAGLLGYAIVRRKLRGSRAA